MDTRKPCSIFWFRRDLRLTDNAGLHAALSSGIPVLPIFIFDENILSQLPNTYDRRVDMIHQCLNSLKRQLQTYNSDIIVFHGKPADIFAQLITQYSIHAVYTNADYKPYATKRDAEIKNLLAQKNIHFFTHKDHVIFESHEISSASRKPYTVYSHYAKAWKTKLAQQGIQSFSHEFLNTNFYKISASSILSLEELGFQKTDYTYTPYQLPNTIISNYENTRDIPAIHGTSRVSEHLRFGTISIRELVLKAQLLNETWLNELIWRDFFMSILHTFPHVASTCFKQKYEELSWKNNEDEFNVWCSGKTGHPIVDAGMRELNQTGFMHNRVRMITASFLCKHLLIDWRWGEAYFAQKLTDYELSSNNGNWQWAASTGCDAVPYFRIFNPTIQQQRFDPDLQYIKKWIPEYGTSNYPKPIVEHSFARNRAIETYKNCAG